MSTIAKGLPLLDMTEGERRIICFLLEHGRSGQWMVTQGHSLSRSMALHMNWNENSVRTGIRKLRHRGWVATHTEKNGRPKLALLQRLTDECKLAMNRKMVRSAIGLIRCEMYSLSDEAVDEVHELALKLRDAEMHLEDNPKLPVWINRVAAERYPISRYDT